jgi:hypothetical protein
MCPRPALEPKAGREAGGSPGAVEVLDRLAAAMEHPGTDHLGITSGSDQVSTLGASGLDIHLRKCPECKPSEVP